MRTTNYQCIHCSRTYKKQENYSKHVVTCAFFHNLHMQSPDDFSLSVEDLPSQREMYQLMKELAYKYREMEKKVMHLEQTVNIRQRKQIISWLNIHRSNTVVPLYAWTMAIAIDSDILATVFREDLTEGIKAALTKTIAGGHKQYRPLAAFTQKANTLYIHMEHDNEASWTSATNENVEKMVFILSQNIMRKFMAWRVENETAISESEEKKDQEILYMIKVNGSKVSDEKRASDIKKWLIATLEEDLEMYEYV